MAALLLAACGSPDAADESSGRQELVYWDLGPGPNRTPYTRHMIEVFEERNPDIKVRYVPVPSSVSGPKVIAAVVADNPPDVSDTMGTAVSQLIAMGAHEDLAPYVEKWAERDAIDPKAYDYSRLVGQGGMYYLPTSMGSNALYYRKDWFEQDGIKPPTNWDELLKAAQHFTDPANNRYGLAIRGGAGGDTYTFYFMLGALGKPIFDAQGRCQLNDPKAVEGLQFYIDLYRKHKVTQPSGVTDSYQELVASFSSGAAAMYIHNNGSIGDQLRKVGPEKFMTAPLPAGPAGRVGASGMNGYSIYKASKKKEAAWRLVSHFASHEMQSYLCEKTGGYPTNRASQKEPWCADNPYLKAFFAVPQSEAVEGKVPDYLPDYQKIAESLVMPEVQRCLMGSESAQAAADKIAAALTDSYQKWLKNAPSQAASAPAAP